MPAPSYRIGDVARLLGLSTHAIRAWERRYGTVAPARDENGKRVYSQAEVDRLLLVKRLADFGHPLTDMASRPTSELEALLRRTRSLADQR